MAKVLNKAHSSRSTETGLPLGPLHPCFVAPALRSSGNKTIERTADESRTETNRLDAGRCIVTKFRLHICRPAVSLLIGPDRTNKIQTPGKVLFPTFPFSTMFSKTFVWAELKTVHRHHRRRVSCRQPLGGAASTRERTSYCGELLE